MLAGAKQTCTTCINRLHDELSFTHTGCDKPLLGYDNRACLNASKAGSLRAGTTQHTLIKSSAGSRAALHLQGYQMTHYKLTEFSMKAAQDCSY